jgi:hypothetical protein
MKRKEIKLTIDELVEMVETRVTNAKRSESLMKRGIASGQLILDEKSLLSYVNVDFTTGEITYIPMEEFMKASQKVQEVTEVVIEQTSDEAKESGNTIKEKPVSRNRGLEAVEEALEIVVKAQTTQVITVESLCERILSSRGTYTPAQLKNQMFKAKSAMIQLAQISHWSTIINDDGSEKRRPVRKSLVEFESVAYSKFWLPLTSDGVMSTDCDYLVCVEVPGGSYTNAKYGWNYAIMRVKSEFVKFNGEKVTLPTRAGGEGTKYEGMSFIDFDRISAGHVDSWYKGFVYLEEAQQTMADIAKALSVLYRHSMESQRLEESADEREARLYEEQEKELAKAGVPALPDF